MLVRARALDRDEGRGVQRVEQDLRPRRRLAPPEGKREDGGRRGKPQRVLHGSDEEPRAPQGGRADLHVVRIGDDHRARSHREDKGARQGRRSDGPVLLPDEPRIGRQAGRQDHRTALAHQPQEGGCGVEAQRGLPPPPRGGVQLSDHAATGDFNVDQPVDPLTDASLVGGEHQSRPPVRPRAPKPLYSMPGGHRVPSCARYLPRCAT